MNYVQYLTVRLVAMMFGMFPIEWNLVTGRMMGRIWYRLIRRHRERAQAHVRLAFGDALSDREVSRLAAGSMQQLTMMAIEVLFTPRLISEWTWSRHVTFKRIDRAIDVLLQPGGAILVTGHYGNWELLGFMLATLGFPLTAVMRPLDNPYLNAFLMDARARRGLGLLYKKGASRSAGDILDSGGILGFIADQNAGHKGLFVDFFGVKASTYKSIGLLAMEHQVPIVIGGARRTSPRFTYEIECNRVIHPHEWADRDDPLTWITQEYTTALEAIIRDDPAQYLWMHRRWKSRPKDEAEPPTALR